MNRKIRMGDGVEYEFWPLSPLAVKDKRVKASLAFLQDYAEGDAIARIKRDIKRHERNEGRIDSLLSGTQWILQNGETLADRQEAMSKMDELIGKADEISNSITKLNKKSDDIEDQASSESKFIVAWMLRQPPNSVQKDKSEAIVTTANCLEPVKTILGFDEEETEAEEVPSPLEPTSKS